MARSNRLILAVIAASVTAAITVNAGTIDPGARDATTSRLFVDWNAGADPEQIDAVRWMGGSNLTATLAPGDCFGGDVEYFGNSWAPPDPQSGGLVLVGAGSTGTWRRRGGHVVGIRSKATGCPAAAGVDVKTRYRFSSRGPALDAIVVKRTFAFDTPFAHDFRPYMPRLSFRPFNEVRYPDASGTELRVADVFGCALGCQVADWNGEWFALYAPEGPLAGQGMIVLRAPSSFAVALWIDNDGGSETNTSSVLALQPDGGFAGRVTEKEVLCFFDAETWTPAMQSALVLPRGCELRH